MERSTGRIPNASATPSIPPRRPRRRLSTRSCRIRRARPGPQGDADGHLALARHSPRQEEARDVGAAGEEQAPAATARARSERRVRPSRSPMSWRRSGTTPNDQPRLSCGCSCSRRRARPLSSESARASDGARSEARDELVGGGGAPVEGQRRPRRLHRHPGFRRVRHVEARRENTDDDVRALFERQHAVDDPGVRGVSIASPAPGMPAGDTSNSRARARRRPKVPVLRRLRGAGIPLTPRACSRSGRRVPPVGRRQAGSAGGGAATTRSRPLRLAW